MKMHNLVLATGKKPARENSIELKLHTYMKSGALPQPADPKNFGKAFYDLIGTNKWGMLGNDNAGDCVLAGGGHETMLVTAANGTVASFTTKNTLSDYSAITGYNPRDPNSDQGTDMQAAASYRRKTGLLDAHGKRHTVTAYAATRKGVVNEAVEAAYLFGFVGIGILFPDYAMTQFNKGEPWDVVQHQPAPDDGHYIPVVGVEDGNFVCVTWGRKQLMTPAFFKKFNDEGVAYISDEFLKNGKTPLGFDANQLAADLAQVVKAA